MSGRRDARAYEMLSTFESRLVRYDISPMFFFRNTHDRLSRRGSFGSLALLLNEPLCLFERGLTCKPAAVLDADRAARVAEVKRIFD
jgi:hypothetical protein